MVSVFDCGVRKKLFAFIFITSFIALSIFQKLDNKEPLQTKVYQSKNKYEKKKSQNEI